nr:hybrid signal transduction histidine kinase M [Tanacetum cinerariifolium]
MYPLMYSLNVPDIDMNKLDTLCWMDIHNDLKVILVGNVREVVRARGPKVHGLGFKSHVKEEASSSTTNPEWCKLDNLIKMWILESLCDSLQEQVVTALGNAKAL